MIVKFLVMEPVTNIPEVFNAIVISKSESITSQIPIKFRFGSESNLDPKFEEVEQYLSEHSLEYRSGAFKLIGPLVHKYGNTYKCNVMNYKTLSNEFLENHYAPTYNLLRATFIADLEDNIVQKKEDGYCYNTHNEKYRPRILIPFNMSYSQDVLNKMISYLTSELDQIFEICLKVNGYSPNQYKLHYVHLPKANHVLIECRIRHTN